MTKIKFDSASIHCWKQDFDKKYTIEVKNEDYVVVGENLKIEAVQIKDDYTVDSWHFGTYWANGSIIVWRPARERYINQSDNSIHIYYKTRKSVDCTINFDNTKVRYEYWDKTTKAWKQKTLPVTAKEGTKIRVTAINVDNTKIVDRWEIGKTHYDGKGPIIFYLGEHFMKMPDSNKNPKDIPAESDRSINISYTLKNK